MARNIKPLVPPVISQPSDNPNIDPKFRLDATELFLFDIAAQEPINISGTECELFQRDLAQTKSDPLYSEPIRNVFVGPYLVIVNIEWPEFQPEPTEAGMRALWPSGAWIPRASLEQIGARDLREGDILRFWKLPYFDERAVRNQGTPGAGFYFDVIKVVDDGHIHDTASFVGFKCDLKRRSNFGPEQQFVQPKGKYDACE